MFPMVTGIRFFINIAPQLIFFAPSTNFCAIIPAGKKYILAILCSYPRATKVVMGTGITKSLVRLFSENMESNTARHTNQLQRIPREKSLRKSQIYLGFLIWHRLFLPKQSYPWRIIPINNKEEARAVLLKSFRHILPASYPRFSSTGEENRNSGRLRGNYR